MPDPVPDRDPDPEPEPVRSAFDGLSRNGSTEPSFKFREHHRRAGEQRTRSRGNAFESECDREVKNGNAFHRATTSDLVVTSLDATGRGAESFGGIQNRGRRSTEQLVPKIRAQRRCDRRAGATSVERNAVDVDKRAAATLLWSGSASAEALRKVSSVVAAARAPSGARTTVE